MRKYDKLNILTSSSKTDVRVSGGNLIITGLDPMKLSDITSIEHRLARAEVLQVFTIGTSVPTVVAGMVYSISIVSPGRIQGFENISKKYSYTAPSVLSGSAATDRSKMYVALAAKINADANAHMTAVADVGGAGVSMTLTDAAGYYAARPSTRGGANSVKLTAGFTESVHLVLTTAAVIGFGQGTRMLQDVPVVGPMTDNLDLGEYDGFKNSAGTVPVSGQTYDGVFITYRKSVQHQAVSGLSATKEVTQAIIIDNGQGTSTANATGYLATFREIKRMIYSFYANDPSAIVEFFDSPANYAGIATPAPLGTNTTTNIMNTAKNIFTYYVNGTATILAPYIGALGCPLSLDATDDEGLELSAPIAADCPKEFVVGQTEFSLFTQINLDDISGTDAFFVGLRKKEAYAADPNDYNDMATLALVDATGAINISTIKTNAATVNTASTKVWADTETHTLEIRVAINGTVTFLIDGVDVSGVQAVAYKFTAGLTVIPFMSFLQAADIAVPYCMIFAAIPGIIKRS